MNTTALFTAITQVGIDLTITTKTRPGDSFYVSAYRPTLNAHSRKAFETEAEMAAAIEQCVNELLVSAPDYRTLLPCRPGFECMYCSEGEPDKCVGVREPHTVDVLRHLAEQTGHPVDHASFDTAKEQYDNFDDDENPFG